MGSSGHPAFGMHDFTPLEPDPPKEMFLAEFHRARGAAQALELDDVQWRETSKGSLKARGLAGLRSQEPLDGIEENLALKRLREEMKHAELARAFPVVI